MAMENLNKYLTWLCDCSVPAARKKALMHGVFAYLLTAESKALLQREAKLRVSTRKHLKAFAGVVGVEGKYASVVAELEEYLRKGYLEPEIKTRAVRYRTQCIADLVATVSAGGVVMQKVFRLIGG